MNKVEEEELSELQLRLLALQSASKKWQQKEQQVMKKSKDRIIKATQEKNSSSVSGVTAPAKQRVATRSTSSAAAPAERNRTRSKPVEREHERSKAGPRPADKERPLERDRPKPGPKYPLDKVWTPGKPHTKKLTGQGERAPSSSTFHRALSKLLVILMIWLNTQVCIPQCGGSMLVYGYREKGAEGPSYEEREQLDIE